MKIFTGLLTVISVFLLTAAPVQEAALILLDSRETVTVNPDGTSHTEDRSVYRILNHDGLKKMRHLPCGGDRYEQSGAFVEWPVRQNSRNTKMQPTKMLTISRNFQVKMGPNMEK